MDYDRNHQSHLKRIKSSETKFLIFKFPPFNPYDSWCFRYGWDLGAEMCRATGFILTFFGIAAINNLTIISLFRSFILMDKKVGIIDYDNNLFDFDSREISKTTARNWPSFS